MLDVNGYRRFKGGRNLKFERVKRIEAEMRIPAPIKEVADNRYCM